MEAKLVVNRLRVMRSWRCVQIQEIKKRLSNSLRTLETRDSSVSNCFMTGVSSKLSPMIDLFKEVSRP
jgi:hypothetical protein